MKYSWLCIFALLLSGACFPHQKRIDAYREKIEKNYPQASRILEANARKAHYVRTGTGTHLIVFIHGSPGSWDAFAEYLANPELQQLARMVSVDRLGFGKSEPMAAEKSLAAHCSLIKGIILEERMLSPPGKIILVGHSFGGPVAARLAADVTTGITDLLLLAPSVDPELEKIEWYQRIADWRVVRWLLPQSLDHANQEILPLRAELEKMKPLWGQIRAEVTVVHGTDDALVPVGNVDFLRNVLVHKPAHYIIIPNQGHFIPWERSEIVTGLLLKTLSPVNAEGKGP